jgi:AAA family ATP:ADP antiporter
MNGLVARLLRATATIDPHEIRAVVLSFFLFFFLLGSYFILRPVREMLGTVYGADNLEQLFTATSIGALISAPIYAGLASRIKLAVFLPWVYGFFIVTLLGFYVLFTTVEQDRWIAAAFYVWVSIFNMFITSIFWSVMADTYSRAQGKRLFGFISAGGSLGAVAGPALTVLLAERIGNNALLLCSAVGFAIGIAILVLLQQEKARVAAHESEPSQTTFDHALGGNPFAGFTLIFKSPYLMFIAGFVLLLTWVSTILYFQQAELVAQAFESRAERTRVFGIVDLIVNSAAIFLQLFGVSRIAKRFGVTTLLVAGPVIMTFAFVALAASPVLMMLLSVMVVRRITEYAITRPGREMLFTVVDQETKYKGKNVIDVVVYRFGDVSSAWLIDGARALGVAAAGIAAGGVVVSLVWGWLGLRAGRRHEEIKAA